MPDLDDDLFATFKTQGSPVNPLPASEVRRRGDRMRRRNNTLAAVGGVAAALVVIATPLAVVANQSSPEKPDPPIATQPTQVDWLQEIPGTVDVSLGIQGANAAQDPEPTDQPGVIDIEVCGETAFAAAAGTVDVAGATYVELGTEHSVGRTLAVYPDGTAAQEAAARLRDAADRCTSAPGTGEGDTVRFEVSGGQLAADESFVVTRGVYGAGDDFPTQGVDHYVVARTGNALLVTLTEGVAANDQQVQAEQDAVADLVATMSAFSPEAD
ncbi:hypothetical protein [Nocardioides sp. W7]|uniref:hypothetical protein n=1 Tax=Nocardioides sp. W7 TaxID=2931390 RepID=UPI001FCFB728|nr:hypothetical protein [Nocardioides sp. W7]